jgi:hypothetical protein
MIVTCIKIVHTHTLCCGRLEAQCVAVWTLYFVWRMLLNRFLHVVCRRGQWLVGVANSAPRGIVWEWVSLLCMIPSNSFPKNLIIRLKQQIQQKIAQATPLTESRNNTKWMTFTYATPHIRKITNLFKHTNVKIAFKCNNTISQLTKLNTKNTTPPHNKSGIYKLTCNTWKQAYVGQTSRSLKLHFQEHVWYIRNNNPQSAYAQHILYNQHGPKDHLMNNTTMLIPYKQFFIQSIYLPRRETHSQAIPWWAEPANPTSHWPLLHTTWRNQSSNILHTEHIIHTAMHRTSNLPQRKVWVCTIFIHVSIIPDFTWFFIAFSTQQSATFDSELTHSLIAIASEYNTSTPPTQHNHNKHHIPTKVL